MVIMTDLIVHIRPASRADEPFLWDMLYQAIFVPPGTTQLPREILQQPELRRYVEGWGQAGDVGWVAEINGKPIGAIWARLFESDKRGYGYVDEDTPEMSLAVDPGYRGMGIGTRLVDRLLKELAADYKAISLSVTAENPAVHLYERQGFEIIKRQDDSLTMVRRLNDGNSR